LVLVDIHAVWCGPCKAFARALEEDDRLALRLEDFVFAKIDGEKGEGVDLVRRYEVRGYPTFVLLNGDAQLLSRWYGWGGVEAFLDLLDASSEEPLPLAERRARHAAEPSARGAKLLANDAYARGENDAAVTLFRELMRLEPEKSLEHGLRLVEYIASGVQSNSFTIEELDATARPLLDHERLDAARAVGLARLMSHFLPADEGELLAPYLVVALRRSDDGSAASLLKEKQILLVEHALIVEKDKVLALKYRRALLPPGWLESAAELNTFAWWCFEQKINLEEAGRLARRGVELETEPGSKANILDTLAQIGYERGDFHGALASIEEAIELLPSNTYLKTQRARFSELIEGSGSETKASGH
jgi:tetratricopeptide (TPR) repeat protein